MSTQTAVESNFAHDGQAHDTHDTHNHDAAIHSTWEKPTPLPKFQIFIVFLIQFAEPITALVIYPFINQFIRETGITNGDERKTGYYAGIIVRCSLKSCAQRIITYIISFFCVGICIFLRRGHDCYSMGLFIRPLWT